ncbi:hypothetical protein SAMN06296010_1196 [Agreia pratensis]|uniref:Uncharacterized protein n=1 Tax=Agreia pratensis TaxID=150121 RepID=A0A1X7JB10_9MICO|nr:hypothetical protein SAMN06296010_1196 [Agreia pratensis]
MPARASRSYSINQTLAPVAPPAPVAPLAPVAPVE